MAEQRKAAFKELPVEMRIALFGEDPVIPERKN